MKSFTICFILFGLFINQSCQNSNNGNSQAVTSEDVNQSNDEGVDDSSVFWIGTPEKVVMDLLRKQCDSMSNCKLSTGPYSNSSSITECDLSLNNNIIMSILFEKGKVRNYYITFDTNVNSVKLKEFKEKLNNDNPAFERIDEGIFSEGKGREGYAVFMYVKDKVKDIGGLIMVGVADRTINSDYIKSLQNDINRMGLGEVEIIL